MGQKILFFTDMHWGIHGNHQKYLDICKQTMDWLGDVAKANNVQLAIFGGDYFDSRSTLDIRTMNLATEALYGFIDKSNGAHIYMILGNHDLYLKDSTSITSLLAYSGNDHVWLVDQPRSAHYDLNDLFLIPWGYGANGTIRVPDSVDFVFCHNDFPKEFFYTFGKGKTASKKSTSDTDTRDEYEALFGLDRRLLYKVNANDGVIFSGHVHQNMSISLTNSSKLVIAGSPYETEYGFGNTPCGAYLIDLDAHEYEFVPNPHSRRHIELTSSSIEKELEEVNIRDQFVRLKVDRQESFARISEIQQMIAAKEPYFMFNTVFEFNQVAFAGNRNLSENPLSSVDPSNVATSSKLDYINHVIETMDFSQFSYGNGSHAVDRTRLKEIAAEIYGKAVG